MQPFCRVLSLTFVASPLLLACGDSGRASESDSASATVGTLSSSTSGGTQPTEASGSQSGTDATTGGSLSESASGTAPTTSDGTGSTGTTGTVMTTGTTSSGTTDVSTGPPPVIDCSEPPAGHAGPTNPMCVAEPQVGMFNPVVEWKESSWITEPTSRDVMMTPIVTSLTDDNGDGKIDDNDVPDIVYVTYSPGVLRATRGDGSGHLFSVGANVVAGQAGVAAGDIDGDGIVELVVAGNSQLVCFEHDGTLKWTVSLPLGDSYTAPAIADMDGDGSPEIIACRTIFNADGSVRGNGQYGTGNGVLGCTSFAADIDGDGVQEVVVGDALYRPDGSAIWYNGQIDGYPAVADFDLDGMPEIVVVRSGSVRLQDATGAVLWTTPLPGGGGGGPPTIADYDGDGEPEIGVAGRDVYAMFDGDGTLVWHNVTQDFSSGVTGSSVYDFEGDGVADVLYADETNLWVYSGIDGAVKLKYEAHNSNTAIEFALVADVDADGQVEIVLGHNTTGGHGPEVGITVLGDQNNSWRPGRKVWNQHAYSITNVNDNGAIPAMPVANWTVYNNFRSGDLSPPDGDAAPDLTLEAEACMGECGAGKLVVWAQLGNVGASTLTAGATITLYGVTDGVESVLGMLDYLDPLPAGIFTDALVFEVPDSQDLDSLVLRVSTPEVECALDNNELAIAGPFCANIPG